MTWGWAGKILRIDLTSNSVDTVETLKYAKDYLGGRGIAARIAWKELPPGIEAFDPENRLIIMTGPLTGTLAPSSGRVVFCGIAPQAYPEPHHTRSNMGGWFGPELKYAGFDGLIIQGKASRPLYLWIRDEAVEFVGAEEIWGETRTQPRSFCLTSMAKT